MEYVPSAPAGPCENAIPNKINSVSASIDRYETCLYIPTRNSFGRSFPAETISRVILAPSVEQRFAIDHRQTAGEAEPGDAAQGPAAGQPKAAGAGVRKAQDCTRGESLHGN